MARKVFYSFHYVPDNWRAGKVRNMGAFEKSQTLTDNDWEKVKRGGDRAIKEWIDGQLYGRSCTVVLIGSETAGRRWIDYEITESWNNKKGVVGIHVHRLLDRGGYQSSKGLNPFDFLKLEDGRNLSALARCYDPPFTASADVYAYIAENIEYWVEEAISIRSK